MKTKRLIAFLIAAVMLLALSVPALADETPAGETPAATPELTPAEGDDGSGDGGSGDTAAVPEPMTAAETALAAGKVLLRIATDKVVESSGTAVIPFEILNGGAAAITVMDVVPVYTSSSIISGISAAPDLGDGAVPAAYKLAGELIVSINAAKKATSDGVGYSASVDCYYHEAASATALKTSAALKIIKTSPRVSSGSGEVAAVSKPKLIIESYSLSSARVFAGEAFTLTLIIRNTSESRDVENLTVTVEDSTNTVRPGNNGSNTFYIGKIGDGDSHTQIINLVTEPSVEAGSYTLTVRFDYEAGNHVEYSGSETITIPVAQRIRVRLNDPTVYGDYHTVGDRISMFFTLNNLGKASIYNCMVTVEGEGLAIEESYFGGNIGSGATMSADFDVTASVGGELTGEIVVTYEDVYGEAAEERLPFTVYVEEAFDPGFDEPSIDDPSYPSDVPTGSSFPWIWVIVGAAAVGAAVLVIVLVGRKKRRQKELQDI